jgi:hypothetical protein
MRRHDWGRGLAPVVSRRAAGTREGSQGSGRIEMVSIEERRGTFPARGSPGFRDVLMDVLALAMISPSTPGMQARHLSRAEVARCIRRRGRKEPLPRDGSAAPRKSEPMEAQA